jgi:hypothetical protein
MSSAAATEKTPLVTPRIIEFSHEILHELNHILL